MDDINDGIRINLGGLTWVFELLEEWLRTATGKKARARELYVEALLLTQQHIRNIETDSKYRNESEEKNLAQAWKRAAIAVQPFSQDLYQRCLAKCFHWSGCTAVERSVLNELDISIETMINIASNLD